MHGIWLGGAVIGRVSPKRLFVAGIACRAAIKQALEMNPNLDFGEFTYDGRFNPVFHYDINKIPEKIRIDIYCEGFN